MKFYLTIFLLLSFNQSISAQMSDKEVNQTMVEVAKIYSENLPMQIDKATILIQIFAGFDRDIVYKYSVKVKPSVLKDGKVRNYFTETLSEHSLKKEINNYCSQPLLKIFKDNDVTMEHNFVDNNNRYLFDIRISANMC
tara:strand:- start:1872 stop:2288 length:417 start_codon:yes stop_codon:yes gene_type:complete